MIKPTLSILKDELNSFLEGKENWDLTHKVILGNITQYNSVNDGTFDDRIVISLINTENDKVQRNTEFKRQSLASNDVKYANPKVSINLYILFSASFSTYENALDALTYVFEFFQYKNVFTALNTPAITDYESLSNQQKMTFKLILDLHSLTLEQLNHIWSTAGCGQLPAVLFKARVVRVFNDQIHKRGPVITQAQSSEIIN